MKQTRFLTERTLVILMALALLMPATSWAADYSTSLGGNVRVEALSTTNEATNDGKAILSTAFGGDEEESTTGGDTHLQWSHRLANDAGTSVGTGFIRFISDGEVRVNVEATSQLGNFEGSLKAEWQTEDGFAGSVEERDQFATLTHSPSGVYYKIGREEWLGNQKGYVSDFLSATKSLADGLGNTKFSNRFGGHALGWRGNGYHAALLLQRTNLGSDTSVTPTSAVLGVNVDNDEDLAPVSVAVIDPTREVLARVDTYGARFGYKNSVVDLALTYGESNIDGSADDDYVQITEFQMALDFGRVKPFVNWGTATRREGFKENARPGRYSNGSPAQTLDGDTGLDEDGRPVLRQEINAKSSGWNIGATFPFGASDLVLAYGSGIYTNQLDPTTANGGADYSVQGYDVIWATNRDPLKVSLAYSDATSEQKADENVTKYGVRLDFGF